MSGIPLHGPKAFPMIAFNQESQNDVITYIYNIHEIVCIVFAVSICIIIILVWVIYLKYYPHYETSVYREKNIPMIALQI